MKKLCLRCAGFLLILALFIGILSAVFYPKGRGYNDGLENPRIWAFQAEPKNSLEVLAIGDSLLMCGYSPLDVWTQRGYTGFGCCTGNQRLTQSLRMLEAFCENQSPKVVFLEADSLYHPIDSQDILRDRVLPLIPALEYHDNWKIFSAKGFLRAPDYSYLHPQKGTHFLYDRDPQVPEEADSWMTLGSRSPLPKQTGGISEKLLGSAGRRAFSWCWSVSPVPPIGATPGTAPSRPWQSTMA